MTVWRPGDPIVLREVLRGRVWTARPVTVVEDRDDRQMFYVRPGMRWKCPGNPDGSWQRVPGDRWTLGDRVWEGKHVLSFAWPGVSHAVLLYWGGRDWGFQGWYVNLQEPLRRTGFGFDYMDHMLDIEVRPDRTWTWKDRDELEESVRRGVFSPDLRKAVLDEAERAARRIERAEPPFDGSWRDWRPDEGWPAPELPPGWHRVD